MAGGPDTFTNCIVVNHVIICLRNFPSYSLAVGIFLPTLCLFCFLPFSSVKKQIESRAECQAATAEGVFEQAEFRGGGHGQACERAEGPAVEEEGSAAAEGEPPGTRAVRWWPGGGPGPAQLAQQLLGAMALCPWPCARGPVPVRSGAGAHAPGKTAALLPRLPCRRRRLCFSL